MHFLSVALLAASVAAQPAQTPGPNKIIEANDGDVIVVRDRAAVRIVRRMEGDVRVIYNAAQQWIVGTGRSGDGRQEPGWPRGCDVHVQRCHGYVAAR